MESLIRRASTAAAALGFVASTASGALLGTTPVAPGGTIVPIGIAPLATPGTLLAHESENFSFSTTGGTTSGHVLSAVFQEAPGGTLDFYYQIFNDTSSASSIARLSATDFTGWQTSVGYWTNVPQGSAGTGFVAGTWAPQTADSSLPNGSTIGFNFNPPVSNEVAPGTASNILTICTNATNFAPGNVEIIDAGSETLPSYQPAPVPEPTSIALLAVGSCALVARRKRRHSA
jgi:hypothetical protein